MPLSQNLYTYTMNNPVKYADPSGHYVEEKQAYLDQIASLNEQISAMQNAMYSSGLSTRSAIQNELERLNRSLASSRDILDRIEGRVSYQQAAPKQDRMIQAANAASMRVSCDVNPSVRHIDPWQSAWDEVYEDNWWWINSVLSIYEVGRDTGAMIHKNDLTVRFGEDPTWENGLPMAGDLLTGHVISTGWNYLLSPHVDRASAWIKDPLDSGKFMNMWTAGISDTLSGVFVPPEGVVPEEWYGSTDWYKHVYSSALIVYGGYKTIQAANVPVSKTKVLYVTEDGVVFDKQIPSNYVQNPYRKGSYGIIDPGTGKFKEMLRIDPATPRGKPGPEYPHYHLEGKSEHFSPRPSDNDPWQ